MKTRKEITPSKLRLKTVELLKNRSRSITYEKISIETGLSVAWLDKFGRTETSSLVDNVEALYNYLSNQPLTV